MWREESGFLEMFLAYYSQFEENVSGRKAYRDFLLEVLCAHELSLTSFSSVGGSTTQTQLEAAANALHFPWTAAFPVEPSNPGSCLSEAEAAIQPKTEVLDDECEIVCEMPCPSQRACLTSKSKIEFTGEMKTEDEAASRICDNSWSSRQVSDSKRPPASISVEEPGVNLFHDLRFESEAASNPCPISIVQSEIDAVQRSVLSQNDASNDVQGSRTKIKEENTAENEFPTASHSNGHGYSCADNLVDKVTFSGEILDTRSQDMNNEIQMGYQLELSLSNSAISSSSQSLEHKTTSFNRRSHVCRFCSKSFSKSTHMRDHERIHTGDRPFICRFCNKSFSQASNMRRHERVHYGGRPFVRNFCQKSFSEASNVRRHERKFGKRNFSDLLYIKKRDCVNTLDRSCERKSMF